MCLTSTTCVRLLPHLKNLIARHNPSLDADRKSFTSLALALHQNRDLFIHQENDRTRVEMLIRHIFHILIENTNLNLHFTPHHSFGSNNRVQGHDHHYSSAYHSSAVKLIELAFSLGAETHVAILRDILDQLRPSSSVNPHDWFSLWFSPFIMDIKRILQRVRWDLGMQPFSGFTADHTISFIRSIGSSNGSSSSSNSRTGFQEVLKKLVCNCPLCDSIRDFLQGPETAKLVATRSVDKIHVEKALFMAKASSFGMSVVRSFQYLNCIRLTHSSSPIEQ